MSSFESTRSLKTCGAFVTVSRSGERNVRSLCDPSQQHSSFQLVLRQFAAFQPETRCDVVRDGYHTSGSFTRRFRHGVGAVKSDEAVIENVLENVTFFKIFKYLQTGSFLNTPQ